MEFFKNLTLRRKLFFAYGFLFTITLSVVGVFSYQVMRSSIEENIESELSNSTSSILALVQTSALSSTKNYLRAVAESNLEIVEHFYNQWLAGEISEDEARRLAEGVLLNQKIGRTGYIYCIDSDGIVVVHPKKGVIGQDVSNFEFVRDQIKGKLGYVEYQWKNPGETNLRPKALYMSYFKPWDWIISVTSYREEFGELVDVGDLKDSVSSLKFGKTGYSYVAERNGKLLIHPKHDGKNVSDLDDDTSFFFDEMVEKNRGKIIYSWKNNDEEVKREKLVIYNHIPEYDWLVASSSYLDEFYSPLDFVRLLFITAGILSLLLFLTTTSYISSLITNPLLVLRDFFAKGAKGDFSVRMDLQSRDEVGTMARYFNTFMEKLEDYNASLIESRERYRSVMEAAPDPIIVYDEEGRVSYMNKAFTTVFGWTFKEAVGKKMDVFVPEHTLSDTEKMIEQVTGGKPIQGIKTFRYNKNNKEIPVSISCSPYKDARNNFSGSVTILRDVTEQMRLEKEILKIVDRERFLIAQDLHDDLLPHLMGIEALDSILTNKLADEGHETAKSGKVIHGLINDAIEKASSITKGLCPVDLSNRSIEFALADLTKKTRTIFGVDCDFKMLGEVQLENSEIASHLYYIAKEALHNGVKHASASTIMITLGRFGNEVRLEIKDDGKGFDISHQTDGMGMRIMAWRANMIGAKMDVESSLGKGARIVISLSKS